MQGDYQEIFDSVRIGRDLGSKATALLEPLHLGKSLGLVCDVRTHNVLGGMLKGMLDSHYKVSLILLPDPVLPDETTVTHIREKSRDCDAILAVGSGTINDLCKFASFLDDKPYVIFGTAPSMNGYCSANASIIRDGHKQSFAARLPKAVMLDLDILAQASERLIHSGVGDALCRATAQADWLLSHLLFDTPYNETPFLMQKEDEAAFFSWRHSSAGWNPDVQSVMDSSLRWNAAGRDGIEPLTRLLVISGVGMTLCGGSYPASQGEHMIAHTMEMMHPELPHSYHGEQIAVTSLTMARLQDYILRQELPAIVNTGYDRAAMLHYFGKEKGEALSHHIKAKKAPALTEAIWVGIREKIRAVRIDPAALETALKSAGAPTQPEDIGWPVEQYAEAVRHALYTRDRFTFLDLAHFTGMLDGFVEKTIIPVTLGERAERALVSMFLQVVTRENAPLKALIDRKLRIDDALTTPQKKIPGYRSLLEELSGNEELRLAFVDTLAKMSELGRSARKIAGVVALNTYEQHQGENGPSASTDAPEYVLKRLREEGATTKQVQALLDKNGVAWFSLTAHPTNPSCLDFSKKLVALEQAATGNSYDELKTAMEAFYRQPMTRREPKSMREEIDEAIMVLELIKQDVPAVETRLRAVLEKYFPDVEITKPLVRPCMWQGGDGDGNPNADEPALRYAMEQLTKHELTAEHGFDIKIDIRHNAKDLRATLADVLVKTEKIDSADAFIKMTDEARQAVIRPLLKDEVFLAGVAELRTDQFSDDKSPARRIMGRLRAASEQPELFEKLIIAETATVSDGLGALLLQKATGNHIPIVPLFESVEDLHNAPGIVRTLLKDDTFREAVGDDMLLMIAKSDTFRRDGAGAQRAQERAIEEFYKIAEEESIRVSIKHGGGWSLARGGGRTAEVARITSSAALRGRMENPDYFGPATRTSQGHQMYLEFLSSGSRTMTAAIAQNIHAGAEFIFEKLRYKPQEHEAIERHAMKDMEVFFSVLLETAPSYMENSAMLELARHFPAIFIHLGNDGSRPAARNLDITGEVSFQAIAENYSKVRDKRAITFDRIIAHSGTYMAMIEGVREAFSAIEDDLKEEETLPERLHNMYNGSRSIRDFMRTQATILHMINYDVAWLHIKENRPDAKEVTRLAATFDPEGEDNSVEATLAYMERYTLDVAKGVFMTLTGKEPEEDVTLKDPLRSTWPGLAAQMARREKDGFMMQICEADLNHHISEMSPEEKEKPISGMLLRFIKAVFAAANYANNTPLGITQTRQLATAERNAELSILKLNECPLFSPAMEESLRREGRGIGNGGK